MIHSLLHSKQDWGCRTRCKFGVEAEIWALKNQLFCWNGHFQVWGNFKLWDDITYLKINLMIHHDSSGIVGYINPSCIYQRWVYDVCSTWQDDGRLQEADPNETIYRCVWQHFVFTSTRTIVAPFHDTRNPHQRKLLNWCPTLEARSSNVSAFDNKNHGMICLQGNRCWPERRQWKTPNTQKSFHFFVESNGLIVKTKHLTFLMLLILLMFEAPLTTPGTLQQNTE